MRCLLVFTILLAGFLSLHSERTANRLLAASPAAEVLSGTLLIQNNGENVDNLVLENFGEPPRMAFRYALGTKAAPLPVGDGSLFGWVLWNGLDTDGQYKNLGNIEMVVDAPPAGANAIPGAMSFWTVNSPAGPGYPYVHGERLRIDSRGHIIVGLGDGEGQSLGEKGVQAVTGTTIRAPDLAGGVDQAGASLFIATGKGTDQGTPGTLAFQTTLKAPPGSAVQGRATIMSMKEDIIQVNALVRPGTTGIRSLGSADAKWADVWANAFHAGDIVMANGYTITEHPNGISIKRGSKPIFSITDDYLEFGGVRVTAQMLEKLREGE